MESRLAQYRLKKREELKQNPINHVTTIKTQTSSSLINLLNRWKNYILSSRIFVALSIKMATLPILGWPLLLQFLLWSLLFGLAIELEFGIVYFIVSGFLLLYISTSTRRRKSNEKSAYSVFNENCERLQGTFTAEQFDKQLRQGKL